MIKNEATMGYFNSRWSPSSIWRMHHRTYLLGLQESLVTTNNLYVPDANEPLARDCMPSAMGSNCSVCVNDGAEAANAMPSASQDV